MSCLLSPSMAPQLVCLQPQPQTKVTLTQATLKQSLNFNANVLVPPQIDLDMLFLLHCYQISLLNLSEKAAKQRVRYHGLL